MIDDTLLNVRAAAKLLGFGDDINAANRARTFLRLKGEQLGMELIFRAGPGSPWRVSVERLKGAGLVLDDNLRLVHDEMGSAMSSMRHEVEILKVAVKLLNKRLQELQELKGIPGPPGPPGPKGPKGDQGERGHRPFRRYAPEEKHRAGF